MDKEAAAMHLLRLTHSLEKGMALPSPTPGFGKAKANNIRNQAAWYKDLHGDDEVYRLCMATLASHRAFQSNGETGTNAAVGEDQLDPAAQALAGYVEVTREEFLSRANFDFRSFALDRSSVRNFTGEAISESDLIDSIHIARKSPSVCNRASARAYFSNDRTVIDRALARQSGNRGFGDLAGALFIVTSDMRAFYKSGERNQGWVDGGLFAMSLNYALHSKGYGVCMLNWSMDALDDHALRSEFGIPAEHAVVMMMVAGHVPDSFRVTVSPHRSTDEFAIRLN